MAECAKGVYSPRRPRETAFYRIVEEHYERFEQIYPERYEDKYGYFRPVIRETVYQYLNCGDLKQGFARVRCPDCGHEYLLAFSCKGRYFCTSCHTKRAVTFAEWLHTTILLPAPHRQIVLTIPKMLRIYFRYDRRLLGDLCRVAAGVIVESFHVLLAVPLAQPGLVVCVHTYGDLLNHHPHLHVMATDGAFTPDGVFHALPTMSLVPMEKIFRHRVFKMLMKKGLLSGERVKLMASWEHSGEAGSGDWLPPNRRFNRLHEERRRIPAEEKRGGPLRGRPRCRQLLSDFVFYGCKETTTRPEDRVVVPLQVAAVVPA